MHLSPSTASMLSVSRLNFMRFPSLIFMSLIDAFASIRGFATWSDEDMVGRVARLSRRVGSSRLVALRTMSRMLMGYKRLFERYFTPE